MSLPLARRLFGNMVFPVKFGGNYMRVRAYNPLTVDFAAKCEEQKWINTQFIGFFWPVIGIDDVGEE